MRFKECIYKLLSKGRNLQQRDGGEQLEEINCPTNIAESTTDCVKDPDDMSFKIKKHFSLESKANKQNPRQTVLLIMHTYYCQTLIHVV